MAFSVRALILRALKQIAGAQIDAAFAPLVALINGGLTEENLSARARIPLSMRQRKQGVLALQLRNIDAGPSGQLYTFHVPAVPELIAGEATMEFVTWAGGALLAGAVMTVRVNGEVRGAPPLTVDAASGFVRGILSFAGPPIAVGAGTELSISLAHGNTSPEQDSPFVAVAWLRANHVK